MAFRKPVPDTWRRLLTIPGRFVQALTALGMPADDAAEYADDPNALPREWRQKINALLTVTPTT